MPIIQIQQTQPVTIDNGGTAEIRGASSQAVTFEGATGTLKLDDAPAFTGQISGLTGSDAVDLADISYGANTKATFSGNANGGTLTVTNGTQTANIALLGNYLSSGWTFVQRWAWRHRRSRSTVDIPECAEHGRAGWHGAENLHRAEHDHYQRRRSQRVYFYKSTDHRCQQRDDRELQVRRLWHLHSN